MFQSKCKTYYIAVLLRQNRTLYLFRINAKFNFFSLCLGIIRHGFFLGCPGSLLKKIFYACTRHIIGRDDNRPLIPMMCWLDFQSWSKLIKLRWVNGGMLGYSTHSFAWNAYGQRQITLLLTNKHRKRKLTS